MAFLWVMWGWDSERWLVEGYQVLGGGLGLGGRGRREWQWKMSARDTVNIFETAYEIAQEMVTFITLCCQRMMLVYMVVERYF